MNCLIITGNLASEPISRMVQTVGGEKLACNFTVAVNDRGSDEATFFRVTAWGKLGELCMSYLHKGKKVGVSGHVAARAYKTKTGEYAAQMDVTAHEVEFLSPKETMTKVDNQEAEKVFSERKPKQVSMDEDVPF